jgi:hypothetical protein
MKYMLMMHAPRGSGGYEYVHWAPEDWAAHLEYWRRLNAELAAAGEFVETVALTEPGRARLVRAADGPPVTDGPFSETKAFLAGYWIVDVGRPERAVEIAARASAAPGPGGAPLDMPVEVRQVMSAPPADGHRAGRTA